MSETLKRISDSTQLTCCRSGAAGSPKGSRQPARLPAIPRHTAKPSAFLTAAAEAIDGGFTPAAVPGPRPPDWEEFLQLTLPEDPCYDHHAEDLVETRVLRYLLAATVAKASGR